MKVTGSSRLFPVPGTYTEPHQDNKLKSVQKFTQESVVFKPRESTISENMD